MKRKMLISVILILSIVVMCGCGGNKLNDTALQTEIKPEEQNEMNVGETAASVNCFHTEYNEIKDDTLTAELKNGIVIENRLYFTSLGVLSDETPDGITPEWPEQYWNYGPVLCEVDLDGTTNRIPYIPAVEDNAGQGNSGVVFERICEGPENSVWVLENHYHTWNDSQDSLRENDPAYNESMHSTESYKLVCLDRNGSVLKQFPVDQINSHQKEAEESEGSYSLDVPGMVMDSEGDIYIAVRESFIKSSSYGEENRIIKLDGTTGLITESFSMTSAPEYLISLSDGRIATAYYEGSTPVVGIVDFKGQTISNSFPADGFLNILIAGSTGESVCYGSGDSLYEMNLENGDIEKILDWTACDVARTGEESVCILEDGSIVTTSCRETAGGIKNDLVILKPGEGGAGEKKTLRMAVMNLYPFTSEMISQFNRTNPDYRIEVTDYAQYNDYSSQNEEDWNAGLTRLQTEIIAGNVPDLLDISLLSANQLGAQGLLTDLYPYIDSDTELDRNQLNQHVLSAFEENGKLYQTVGNFYVLTTGGLSSVVGEKAGWTMEEFRSAMNMLRQTNPESTVFDIYTTRSDILTFLLYLEMGNYVDWETGECRFESQSFIDLLEFVNGFPASFDWSGQGFSPEDLEQDNRILKGQQLMKQCNFVCFEDVQANTLGLAGNPCTFVGYPTESGCGSMFAQIGNSFAISSGCADKEAAWQFVRLFFLPDYQEQFIGSVFPTNLSVYEQMKQEAMTERYQRNPDGSYAVDNEGKRIPKERGSVTVNGTDYPYEKVTDEEIARVESIIQMTTHVLKLDQALEDIIKNGAAAYFEGQYSAEEAARQIQSRANIYINEQK